MARTQQTQKGTLTTGQVVSYSLGDVANNLSFMMTSMFLMVYMTDIAGLAAGIAGAIYGVTKIWAGVTDLVAGNTVDKANTRWGRLRPWLLWGSTPLAVVFVLLFSTPAGLTPAMTVAWILLFDAAFQLAYSFVNIPYGSLAAAMTQDSTDRSRLSGARSIASSITGVALSAIVSPQFQDTTGDDVRLRFTLTTLVLAVIAVALYLICFRNTREVVPRTPGKIKLSNTLRMVRQNKPLIVLVTGAFFMLASMFTMNAVGLYYVRSVLGDASWYTWLMLAQSIGTILVASLLPQLTVQFGTRMTYVGATAISVVAFLLIFIMPAGNLWIALLAWFLFGAGQGGTNATMFSMQADTVDYGEWKTGARSEGGSYSILSFIRKCGQGVGGWAGGAIIAAYGYVGTAPVQTPEAIEGIRIACGVVPAVLAVIAGLIMVAYPLTESQHRDLVAELHQKRTRSVAGDRLGGDDLDVASVGDGRSLRMSKAADQQPIITLFESDGSGGAEIGKRLADELGVGFAAQMFSSERLARVEPDELRNESGLDRFLRSVSYSGTQDSTIAQATELSDRMQIAAENTAQVLSEVENGGVVMGRNATLVLNHVVGAFHVRLMAPLERRVERVQHQLGVDRKRALAQIRNEERLRRSMSMRLYQWDPFDDEYYDLIINTGSVTYDQAVEMIVTAYRSKYPAPGTTATPDEAGDPTQR